MKYKGKKILLIMPEYSDFYELFCENLNKLGFETYYIDDLVPKFKYSSFFEKINNFFRKNILRDKEYKKHLIEKNKTLYLTKKLDRIPNTDFVLVIRPDLFPKNFILTLKNKTEKLIAYQWDGIEKYPDIEKYFPLFDSFFSFDIPSGFLKKYPYLKNTTNFYFDDDSFVFEESNSPKVPKLFFVGSYLQNREKKIREFVKNTDKLNIELDFRILYFNKDEKNIPKIKYIKDRITFRENLNLVKNSDILVDFLDSRHSGLSFRFFEAIKYQKKMITDNFSVENYDFFNHDNIFIIGKRPMADLENFINRKYKILPRKIQEKYSFKNWIGRILSDD